MKSQFAESESSKSEKADKQGSGEEFKMRSVTVTALNTRYLDSVVLSKTDTTSNTASSRVSSGKQVRSHFTDLNNTMKVLDQSMRKPLRPHREEMENYTV